ncbi:metallophosphoesterase [Neoehrlichia mikurensis]|uniref:Metallophosphoesterase n=1 Tax=Neoehrlichia mikurensis TaxID=89586 RepID=A0A9Q9BTT4_9RICK|nr:metallophosphoesterase [Neoehrlichia mikurensis]QXK92174.1 metallophosphoesterase [Neoehrlichia mikurensis]QXK92629.1 metallophosphoesterase [Neoehrlichia mikurensis]QXK93868.1 metallophosphoesterase [Neoehrlichia mikurensis]UTO55136.1 metallophosphoesterase [Neoehrlichia mikurensis]UTO56056.1 metallophosphoesterase [Neoehrlichia mikurensis]
MKVLAFLLSLMIYFSNMYVKADVLFVWSQVVSNNNLSVRAIISAEDDCPKINVDSKIRRMSVRALPVYNKSAVFNNKVCEAVISNTAKIIKVNTNIVPAIPNKIKKIAIIGDTGCRISLYYEQNCKSQDKWPLERILYQVSQHNPDLVIHVGDYLYREKSCSDNTKCNKGVYGDNFNTWKLDWLDPSKLLSKKAPFIFVRGNHEDCNRAYRGWFRYLSASSFVDVDKALCKNIVDSWIFTPKQLGIGDLNFYIYDSSNISEMLFSKQDIKNVRSRFLNKLHHESPMWLLTHRPLWSYIERRNVPYYGSLLQVKAFSNLLPRNLLAIVSGHVHIGQILRMKMKDNIVTQIIVGNSGTKLDNVKLLKMHNVKIGNFIADSIQSVKNFGFTIVNVNTKYSHVKYYDVNNNEVYQLKILNESIAKKISCK